MEQLKRDTIKMRVSVRSLFLLIALAFLTACTNQSDPGPLKGKWQVSGIVSMQTEFRNGETESKGIIEKVSYKVDGNKVYVTYHSGMAKGLTQTYVVVDKDTVESPLGTMKRIP